jgi:outer membrane receptor protein involved in Fe transport
MNYKLLNRAAICCLLSFALVASLMAGTTGKIAGKVTSKASGEALPGANVVIEGTNLGAATDLQGNFTILQIPPGVYRLKASFIGYANLTVTDVRVEIDRTTKVDFALDEELVTSAEVTIIAERPVVQEDVATSVTSVSREEVETLPLSTVTQVVGLQAGVEAGLVIRGGGADEALFLVDGATLRDPLNNAPITGIPLSAIQEISIERGGFNAEYGQVRSGIVNVVAKEGDRYSYSGTITTKYSPPSAKYFGISPYHPNSMWLRPYLDPEVAWTGTENGAWDFYTQRQYPKFDGWNAISARLLADDDPTNDLTPAAAQRLFMFQHRKREVTDQPDYNIDAGFGGPVPLIGNKLGGLRFYASYRNERDMLLIPLTRDDYLDYDVSLKLTSDITPSMKFTVTGTRGKSYNVAVNGSEQLSRTDYLQSTYEIADQVDLFPFTTSSRIFSNSYYSLAEVKHDFLSAKLTHTLGPKTYYDASLEHITREFNTTPTALRDTSGRFEIVPGYFADEAPFGWSPSPDVGIGDGILFGGHTSTARDFSKISSTTFKFDLSSQVNFTHLVKTGVEFVYNDLNVEYGTVNLVFPESNDYVKWRRFPFRGAAYIQDKIETKGFIANLGLRLDYSDANTEWIELNPFDKLFFSSRFNPSADFNNKNSKAQTTLSPRLGISHPITVNSKLFFNYGHFKALPTYEQMFRLSRGAFRQVLNIGNPELALAKTVSYELGYDQALFDTYLIQLAAFYHDITDQPDVATFISADGSIQYAAANNNSYEDIRGFEVTLRKRVGRWWSGFANYTYQVSTLGRYGRTQIWEDPSQQRLFDRTSTDHYQFKPNPQPYARANISLQTPKEFGPDLLGGKPLGGWSANILADWRAGSFTRHPAPVNTTVVHQLKLKDWYNVVLRLSKTFSYSDLKLTFLMDINNLLNTKRLSLVSFYDFNDQVDYFNSLHFPASLAYNNIVGKDKVGDYRKEGVDFQPIEQVGNIGGVQNPNAAVIYYDRSSGRYMNYVNNAWAEVESGRMKKILDDKAYIDMPNQTSFNFLNPRDIFIGLRASFEF